MASTSKCPYCGSTVRSDEQNCPGCGAPNELYVADSPKKITNPKTIAELQEYCAERGMPLLRMRFFIGEDFKEPRAFGIYRDGDKVVVYKNKADGSRAVRYEGPDEEFAVNEIYQKLLQECHNRGIYPDGKPAQGQTPPHSGSANNKGRLSKKSIFLIIAAIIIIGVLSRYIGHTKDGYYRLEDADRTYYLYGSDWYYSYDNDDYNYWYHADQAPVDNYSDYSIGDSWNSSWDVGNFKDSSTWDDINASSDSGSSSSSDWDSWDSGSTDWDSDW